MLRILRSMAVCGACFCSGCASLTSQAPLPRQASLESIITPEADEQMISVVRAADIIYLPTDRLGSVLASEPAWKLLQTMRRNTADLAIAWDSMDASEQPRLDNWLNRKNPAADLPERLELSGSARERENCRTLLRQTRPLHIPQLALHCPEALAEKLSRGGALTPAEQALLPREFAARQSPAEPVARLDESITAVLANEFAAARIVDHLREHAGGKVLVLIKRADMDNANGVPFFVARKLSVRQVVLDSNQPAAPRAHLLTWSTSAIDGW